MSRTPSSNARSATNTSVPLLDVHRQYDELRDDIRSAIDRVCESGRFILGPECSALEQEVAAYCQSTHAVGCASGSDALLLALMALDIGPGDEVIVPSYTFFATASAVCRLGAKVVFAEIDADTFNIDAEHVASLVTPQTKAIIPVHLFGQCADMHALNRVARKYGLYVIEDACQAIGAELGGKRACSMGHIGTLSFYPTKNLGGFGDGGMMTTNDEELAAKLRLLSTHGMSPRYYHKLVGINSRLDALQACVLRVKLPHLERWTDARAANAARYHELFAERGLSDTVRLPTTASGRRHVWNQFVIRVEEDRRDALRQFLTENGVGTEIYYPVPLHMQECFKSIGCREGSLPITEQAARETIALPIFPELSAAEQRRVVDRIVEFFASASSRKLQTVEASKPARQMARKAS
jgi:dTDP-4-amino-4,6-dideoxygalactose transaminase